MDELARAIPALLSWEDREIDVKRRMERDYVLASQRARYPAEPLLLKALGQIGAPVTALNGYVGRVERARAAAKILSDAGFATEVDGQDRYGNKVIFGNQTVLPIESEPSRDEDPIPREEVDPKLWYWGYQCQAGTTCFAIAALDVDSLEVLPRHLRGPEPIRVECPCCRSTHFFRATELRPVFGGSIIALPIARSTTVLTIG